MFFTRVCRTTKGLHIDSSRCWDEEFLLGVSEYCVQFPYSDDEGTVLDEAYCYEFGFDHRDVVNFEH